VTWVACISSRNPTGLIICRQLGLKAASSALSNQQKSHTAANRPHAHLSVSVTRSDTEDSILLLALPLPSLLDSSLSLEFSTYPNVPHFSNVIAISLPPIATHQIHIVFLDNSVTQTERY
jgi:hypothetical protein